jgi:hypothetical protein
MAKTNYESDIVLGERYQDVQTGFEGVATAAYFYQHGCERVSIETYDPERKEVKSETFDSPRLVHVESGQVSTTERTGGPGDDKGSKPVPKR